MPGCGYQVRETRKWLALGAPRCPIVGHGELALERPAQGEEHSTGAPEAEPCRIALSGQDDAAAMAVVEDAEADSVRWLIEQGRSKETKHKRSTSATAVVVRSRLVSGIGGYAAVRRVSMWRCTRNAMAQKVVDRGGEAMAAGLHRRRCPHCRAIQRPNRPDGG